MRVCLGRGRPTHWSCSASLVTGKLLRGRGRLLLHREWMSMRRWEKFLWDAGWYEEWDRGSKEQVEGWGVKNWRAESFPASCCKNVLEVVERKRLSWIFRGLFQPAVAEWERKALGKVPAFKNATLRVQVGFKPFCLVSCPADVNFFFFRLCFFFFLVILGTLKS